MVRVVVNGKVVEGDVVKKVVGLSSNSGRVYVGRSWVGKNVLIVMPEKPTYSWVLADEDKSVIRKVLYDGSAPKGVEYSLSALLRKEFTKQDLVIAVDYFRKFVPVFANKIAEVYRL